MSDREPNTFELLGPRTMRERIAERLLRKPSSPWFTLLLLAAVVVLVIATWIPGFLSAQDRANLTRARSVLGSLSAALDRYRVDHGVFPPRLALLTVPTIYLGEIPRDPWSNTRSSPYRYHTNGASFIIGSFGPDRDEATGGDLPWSDAEAMNALLEDETRLLPFTYDSSNGTFSEGDIWRVGGAPAKESKP